MDADGRRNEAAAQPEHGDDSEVRTHTTRPGRTVFTEDGNTDGWIATDLVVDPEP